MEIQDGNSTPPWQLVVANLGVAARRSVCDWRQRGCLPSERCVWMLLPMQPAGWSAGVSLEIAQAQLLGACQLSRHNAARLTAFLLWRAGLQRTHREGA